MGLLLVRPGLRPAFAAVVFCSRRSAQRTITRQFALHSRWINLAGGILLIGVGTYDLWVNWEYIQVYYAWL
jgi:cytochrome c biogenesis protein CcdA